jgi:type VI protein secretion system component VasF
MKVRGSRGALPQASLAAEGVSAAREQPTTRLASPPVRLLFIAYVVLIAIGLALYIAIGITNHS